MDFPVRNITHTIEREALDILSNSLPPEWIVREMTERDYGIDLYIEIVGEDRRVTGDLIAIQVKGKREVQFNSDEIYSYSGIKKSTINYWLGLPVPVFFIVVCIKSRNAYWSDINSLNRKGQFKGKTETHSIELKKKFDLSDLGLNLFKYIYI